MSAGLAQALPNNDTNLNLYAGKTKIHFEILIGFYISVVM